MPKELNKLSNKELGKLFPVIISDPNPAWKKRFMREHSLLRKIIGEKNIISIEHIGSTAVPGIKAKPTIDILIQVHQDSDLPLMTEKLTVAGYHFISKPENPPPHMMFVKGYTPEGIRGQSFHLHVRYRGDWDELFFRDYLCEHPEAAREYEKLKTVLSKQYPNDRDAYTEKKTDFIRMITRIARESLLNKKS